MDMGQILSVMSSMKNVNMGGVVSNEPVQENHFLCPFCYDTGFMDCSVCDGTGFIKDYEDSVRCGHCINGKQPCCHCDTVTGIQESHGRQYEMFEPGDEVEYAGEVGTVLKDYGNQLLVDLGPCQGTCVWQKYIYGEYVKKVNAIHEAHEMWVHDEMVFPEENKFAEPSTNDLMATLHAKKHTDDEFFPEEEMWGVDYSQDHDSDNVDAAAEPSPEDLEEGASSSVQHSIETAMRLIKSGSDVFALTHINKAYQESKNEKLLDVIKLIKGRNPNEAYRALTNCLVDMKRNLDEDYNSEMASWVKAWIEDESRQREIPRRRAQLEHEIEWCEKAIAKLEQLLVKKPSKAHEINDLKRQIRQKQVTLAFDPSYGGEVKELPAERKMMDRLEENESFDWITPLKNARLYAEHNMPEESWRELNHVRNYIKTLNRDQYKLMRGEEIIRSMIDARKALMGGYFKSAEAILDSLIQKLNLRESSVNEEDMGMEPKLSNGVGALKAVKATPEKKFYAHQQMWGVDYDSDEDKDVTEASTERMLANRWVVQTYDDRTDESNEVKCYSPEDVYIAMARSEKRDNIASVYTPDGKYLGGLQGDDSGFYATFEPNSGLNVQDYMRIYHIEIGLLKA